MRALDWIFLLAYFALLVVIGVQSIRRVRTSDDFAVAGGRIIWPVIFATLAASFLGGGSSMGNAGNVFSDGYVFLFAFFAFSLQTVLIGVFVAHKLRRYAGAHTVGDVMEHHYGRFSRLLSGVLSIAVCAGILGAQALAIGTVFNTLLDVNKVVGIVVGMGIVLLYSTFGGMWAVIQTDVLQFIILGVFLPVTLLIGLFKLGGPGELAARVPDVHTSFLGNWTVVAFIGVFLAFLLGETLVPPYTQRAFAAKDPRASRLGYLTAGIFSFGFFFVTASIGMVALLLFPNIAPDQALPTVVANLLPVGVTGLVLAALLAVIMSTADSYLNSTAVSFVKDIYVPFLRPTSSDRQRLIAQRVLTLAVGVGAVVFALSAPSIIDALLLSYDLWAPTVVIPLIAAVIWGIRSPAAGVSAVLAGGATMAVWKWVLGEPFGITGLMAGVVVNIVVLVSVYLLTKPLSGARVGPREQLATAGEGSH